MNQRLARFLVIVLVGLLAGACSRKTVSSREETKAERERSEESRPGGASSEKDSNEENEEGEDEEAPEAEDVEVDCVAFLRATIATPANGASPAADCPTCPATEPAPEVLKFDQVKIDQVTPSDTTCEVAVRIFGTFNPSRGGTIMGGLTRWIPAEQKAQYARGETPAGQQVYPVKVTYQRATHGWRAIEFN